MDHSELLTVAEIVASERAHDALVKRLVVESMKPTSTYHWPNRIVDQEAPIVGIAAAKRSADELIEETWQDRARRAAAEAI